MKLEQLAQAAHSPLREPSHADVEIMGLAHDSRAVSPGDLFFCVSGFAADGHDYAERALEAGAAALVVERSLGLSVPELQVDSARAAMAPVAACFYAQPSQTLRVLGVTGTNGKTTTAYLIRALLEATEVQCGLLGTVASVIGGRERSVTRTTPESIDLQRDLREMLDGGDEACAMEVSSHALALGRVSAVTFAAAVFTNLTQDHLDFHPTMEDYFLAKRALFLPGSEAGASGSSHPRPALAVVNVADSYGRRLAEELDGAVTYAVEAPADYSAVDLRCDLDGCAFVLHAPAGRVDVRLPMPGRFNVANALAALATVHALGGALEVLVAALERGVHVPGRFEPVDAGQGFAVLVDYAHTPDSLDNVLRSARELVNADAGDGRVVCVFGAGGDRDRGKRPLMGEIASRRADVALVTSDNPRSESPERIIEEIMRGVTAHAAHVQAVVDRRAAIVEAVSTARPGDVVVIAGKGHEQGQEFADGRKVPFDDVAVARAALEARAPGMAGSAAR